MSIRLTTQDVTILTGAMRRLPQLRQQLQVARTQQVFSAGQAAFLEALLNQVEYFESEMINIINGNLSDPSQIVRY